MKKYLLIILTVFVISGCDALKSHSRYILENKSEICAQICSQPIDTETNVVTKDTIWSVDTFEYVLPDSLMIAFYFECDSNRQVMLKNEMQMKNKYGKLLYEFEHGRLNVTALYDTIEVKNKIIHELRTSKETQIVKVPVEVYKDVVREVVPWYLWCLIGISAFLNGWLLIKKGV